LPAAPGDKSCFEAFDVGEVVRFVFINPHVVDHAATCGHVDEGPCVVVKQGVDLLVHGGGPFMGMRPSEGINVRRGLNAVFGEQ
jgi:hypothetical protein